MTVDTFVGGSACGHRDAMGAAATFNAPRGIACDADGFVYVADTGNHSIRIVHSNGNVACAPFLFCLPYTIAIGLLTNNLQTSYVLSFAFTHSMSLQSHRSLPSSLISRMCTASLRCAGLVRTLAGGGDSGSSSGYADAFRLGARFCEPTDLCIGVVRAKDRVGKDEDEGKAAKHTDKHGRSAVIFVADSGNALIRRVNPDGAFTPM